MFDKLEQYSLTIFRCWLYLVALVAGVLMVRNEMGHPLNRESLYALAMAAIVPLLTRVKEIVWGDKKISLSEAQVKQIVEERVRPVEDRIQPVEEKAQASNEAAVAATEIASAAKAAAENGIGKSNLGEASVSNTVIPGTEEPEEMNSPILPESVGNDAKIFSPNKAASIDPEDPQRGQWGGKSVNNNRKLEAMISRVPNDEDLHAVDLTVRSLDPSNPLEGVVVFHLHPTFSSRSRTVAVRNGEAHLRLVAWGAFTVGAEADNGKTPLEINLCNVPGASDVFYTR